MGCLDCAIYRELGKLLADKIKSRSNSISKNAILNRQTGISLPRGHQFSI